MGIELRIPNISGSERDQLVQIRSYLMQLVPQLEWALNNVASGGGTTTIISSTVKQTGAGYVPSSGQTSDSAKVTFEQLKPLIIKSADIVQSYYEIISKRLDGDYVAESDFGIFKGETSQTLEATSDALKQNFTNTQTIISDLLNKSNALSESVDGALKSVESIGKEVRDTKAHIITGVIDYRDGFPVYGVEIGQRNFDGEVETFNKYARFAANRLSFYDRNNIEVAYISDFKLYINDVEINRSLIMGSFVEKVMSNGDIVTKNVYVLGGE